MKHSNESEANCSPKTVPVFPATKLPIIDLTIKVETLYREMVNYLHHCPVEAHQKFRHWLTVVSDIRNGMELQLPGMPPKQSKARGSLEDVISYAREHGVGIADAEWFYFKMQGSGWVVSKQPVRDWRSTLEAWRRARYLPSQKVTDIRPNGAVRPNIQPELTPAVRDTLRDIARLNRTDS